MKNAISELKDKQAMAWHNVYCYSTTMVMDKPKPEFKVEFKAAKLEAKKLDKELEKLITKASKFRLLKTYKGWVIALNKLEEYQVFVADEWAYGEGLRYPEFECGSLKECMDNIDDCVGPKAGDKVADTTVIVNAVVSRMTNIAKLITAEMSRSTAGSDSRLNFINSGWYMEHVITLKALLWSTETIAGKPVYSIEYLKDSVEIAKLKDVVKAEEPKVEVSPVIEFTSGWTDKTLTLDTTGLTEMEIKVMIGVRTNCFSDIYAENLFGDWSFGVCDAAGLEEKVYRGVASSLIKKGFITISDSEGEGYFRDMMLNLTGKGRALYGEKV